MNRALHWVTLLAFVIGSTLTIGAVPGTVSAQPIAAGAITAGSNEYVVLYAAGASMPAARAAIRAAGGTIVRENMQVGVATVHATSPNFLTAVSRQGAIAGVARNAPVGHAPGGAPPKRDPVEHEHENGPSAGADPHLRGVPLAGAEPLADLQWDMQMINATEGGSYAVQPGDRRVLVGVMDTGVDGSHPDIAPNFSLPLSRNFTTDIPFDERGNVIDGPCDQEADGSCNDPADVDENGHGTHVASTIASPRNGIGIAGVAPNVTLVNLRAGQDSGYFFLQSVVDALTYAGDIGIDVVNMSFYIDPWLFNCTNNPADSAEQQAQQRTTIDATQRALDYAHARGVTLIASIGNNHADLDTPPPDGSSPNYPVGTNHPRTIARATCLTMPHEGTNVLSITSVGPSKAKADYSNYGFVEATVAAPGGFFRDNVDTNQYGVNENLILAAYPRNVGVAAGNIESATGDITPAGAALGVIRDCQAGVCAYYQRLQGTSMAAPHATGVAALIISQRGVADGAGGVMMDPAQVETFLRGSALDTPCPTPPTVDYGNINRPADYNATCVGTAEFNNFYGDGIIDALKAAQLSARIAQTITFDTPAGSTYMVGDTFTVGARASSGLTVGFAVAGPCTIDNLTVTTTGTGTCTVTATQPGDATYAAAPAVPRDFTIGQRTQTITFATPTGTPSYAVGQQFTIGATASSGLAVAFAASGPCTVVGTTVTTSGAGDCVITASQPGNATYAAAPDVARTFPIGKVAQTITFGTPAGSPAYSVGQQFTVDATASSGLPITFAASGACTIAGTMVTTTGAGNCTVTASQPGDANYLAAPDVSRAFAVAIPQSTVRASVQGGGGAISPTGDTAYPTGTLATYTATADAGFLFLGWTLDGQRIGHASPLTFTVSDNRALVATFAPRPAFGDVPTSNVAWDAITQLAARGIIKGYPDGSFYPADTVQRAQIAALIVRAMGWDSGAPGGPAPFSDLGNVDPELARAIAILAQRGIANGYGDGTYDPTGEVSHAQAISLIARSMVQAGYWTQVTAAEDAGTAYPNVPATSDHRLDLLTFVKYAGGIPDRPTGQAWQDWQGSASRGWTARVLWLAYASAFGTDRVP